MYSPPFPFLSPVPTRPESWAYSDEFGPGLPYTAYTLRTLKTQDPTAGGHRTLGLHVLLRLTSPLYFFAASHLESFLYQLCLRVHKRWHHVVYALRLHTHIQSRHCYIVSLIVSLEKVLLPTSTTGRQSASQIETHVPPQWPVF